MNTRDEEAARWRRRNHADIESMMNLMLVGIGEATRFGDFKGVYCPPRVRAFYSALHSAHGGGINAREPFRRAHLTVAEYLQFEGSDMAKVARVRRLLELTEAYQRACGYELVKVTRGGGEEHRKTEYVDYLVPVADEAIQRARASETWKKNPGEAKREQVAWALAQLPRVTPQADERKEQNKKLSALEDFTRRREKLIANILEYVEGVEERDGDGAHELEIIEISVVRARQSLAEKKKARAALAKSRRDEQAQRDADERLWEGDEQGRTVTKMSPLSVKNPSKIEEKPDMLAAALTYAARGWRVFPVHWITAEGHCSCSKGPLCTSPGKHPRFPDWNKLANTQERWIRQWWQRWPDANIGILTGERSGLYVVDVDLEPNGFETLHVICDEHGDAWLDTATVKTGSGGGQFYFQHAEGRELKNTVGKIGKGIDTRGTDGFVVAPPSLHASGNRYQWLNDKAPAPMPEWLLKLLTEQKPAVTASPGSKPLPQPKHGAGMALVITEGSRNRKLFDIGCSMRGKGAGGAEIEAELLEINANRCSPPLPVDEVVKIARSASTYSANRVALGA